MFNILPQAEQLLSTLKQLMPTLYQQETLESLLGLFLEGQGHSVPHHCSTKSESAISRFLNYYQRSTRSLIRTVRSYILNLIISQKPIGQKPILQVILDLTTLEKLAYWVYLHLGDSSELDWFTYAQQALILLLPHILLLSLLKQLESLNSWLHERGFEFCLMRCKI
jgi:hypothetical protein